MFFPEFPEVQILCCVGIQNAIAAGCKRRIKSDNNRPGIRCFQQDMGELVFVATEGEEQDACHKKEE